jgi:dUTP pyrophosphatase
LEENKVQVKIKRLSPEFNDIPLPSYATQGSSGLDVRAAVSQDIILKPGSFELVPTNFSVEIPVGYEIEVRPRSGLAAEFGIGVLNSPGTIDSDYRGEVKIILFNFGKENFKISRGDRIAQMILSKVYSAQLVETENLQESTRGKGGFGHTGKI